MFRLYDRHLQTILRRFLNISVINNSVIYRKKYLLSVPLSNSFNFCQRHSTMDISTVTKVLEEIAPLKLAESWDNVGLLVERATKETVTNILFTNDLTLKVLDEALEVKADFIYSYHPPIFSPLKRLHMSDWKHRIILTCIEKQIAIYSPHTALDASEGGVNDWLISCFSSLSVKPLQQSQDYTSKYTHVVECKQANDANLLDIRKMPGISVVQVSSNEMASKDVKVLVNDSSLLQLLALASKENFTLASITKCEQFPLLNHGMGRIAALTEPISIHEAVSLVKKHVGLDRLRISFGNGHNIGSRVSSVAVCAGSGASVLRGANAHLFVTGEMSHHELLDASQRGITVILCEHSNSERGFLKSLVRKLEPSLPGVKLTISKDDCDPVVIV